jgi:hypothetical protein
MMWRSAASAWLTEPSDEFSIGFRIFKHGETDSEPYLVVVLRIMLSLLELH